jgi:chromosome segregation ATPase
MKVTSTVNDIRLNSPEKDLLISQLKSQIFEYEQNEKNFNSLQAKYRALQNDFDLVSEEKLRLEYESKQRIELLTKQVNELRSDKESLQNSLNEKLALNKKLFNDNNNLFRTVESRNSEIDALREQIADLEEINRRLAEEKNNFERNFREVTDVKRSQESSITKFQVEIEKLNKVCDEQELVIRNLNDEKNLIAGRSDETSFELKNTLGKLKSREESLNFTNKQLEEANKNIGRMEAHISEIEQSLSRTKFELNSVNTAHAKEKATRLDSDKNNDRLESAVKERIMEIKRLNGDLETLRINHERLGGEKMRLLGEIERLKSHILVITDQNQKVFFYLSV